MNGNSPSPVSSSSSSPLQGDRSAKHSKISVPRLNGGRMGVLATRSPHRPVPIGLSVAQVRPGERNAPSFIPTGKHREYLTGEDGGMPCFSLLSQAFV